MARALELHVIGGGIGESIVIGQPSTGTWGVIDAYNSTPEIAANNATVSLLQHLGVEELAFAALTHPHQDHYSGLANILTEFDVENFWMFDGISPLRLAILIDGLDDPGYSKSMIRLLELATPDKVALQTMAANTVLWDQDDLRITCMSPSGNDKYFYETKVGECFEDGLDTEKASRIGHNLISSSFLLEYKDFRMVLGGDVERDSWKQIVGAFGDRLDSRSVKASHHGSSNGYCDGLWSTMSPTKSAFACVTPYSKGNLPRRQGAEHICEYSSEAFLTASPFKNRIETSKEINLTTSQALKGKFHFIEPAKPLADVPFRHVVSIYVEDDSSVTYNRGANTLRLQDAMPDLADEKNA